MVLLCLSVDSVEKRALSQTASPVREGVLRGGVPARLVGSLFSTPLRTPISATESLPAVGNFPTSTSTQFIAGGTLTSTGLAFDIRDGVQPLQVSASAGSTDDGQAISDMEALIRKLFSEHKVEVNYRVSNCLTDSATQ